MIIIILMEAFIGLSLLYILFTSLTELYKTQTIYLYFFLLICINRLTTLILYVFIFFL
jgi:hypothetical protein